MHCFIISFSYLCSHISLSFFNIILNSLWGKSDFNFLGFNYSSCIVPFGASCLLNFHNACYLALVSVHMKEQTPLPILSLWFWEIRTFFQFSRLMGLPPKLQLCWAGANFKAISWSAVEYTIDRLLIKCLIGCGSCLVLSRCDHLQNLIKYDGTGTRIWLQNITDFYPCAWITSTQVDIVFYKIPGSSFTGLLRTPE